MFFFPIEAGHCCTRCSTQVVNISLFFCIGENALEFYLSMWSVVVFVCKCVCESLNAKTKQITDKNASVLGSKYRVVLWLIASSSCFENLFRFFLFC